MITILYYKLIKYLDFLPDGLAFIGYFMVIDLFGIYETYKQITIL